MRVCYLEGNGFYTIVIASPFPHRTISSEHHRSRRARVQPLARGVFGTGCPSDARHSSDTAHGQTVAHSYWLEAHAIASTLRQRWGASLRVRPFMERAHQVVPQHSCWSHGASAECRVPLYKYVKWHLQLVPAGRRFIHSMIDCDCQLLPFA